MEIAELLLVEILPVRKAQMRPRVREMSFGEFGVKLNGVHWA